MTKQAYKDIYNVVFSLRRLKRLVQAWRAKNKKIVFANGCFDLLHPGHVSLLKRAKKEGDVLILGVNSDSSIKRLKGHSRPILKLKERLCLLSELRSIDFIIPFSQETPIKLIQAIRPDVLVKGADWPKDQIIGRDLARRVVRIPLVKGLSTTSLISRIQDMPRLLSPGIRRSIRRGLKTPVSKCFKDPGW